MNTKLAYILLWFPKPSETFIFREVINLWKMGAPISVYTLYGELKKWLSPEMAEVSNRMTRLGIPFLMRLPGDLAYWKKRNPDTTNWLLRNVPFRKWRSIEVGGENIWAFFSGFTMARLFLEDGIEHIHAPWANGPATAAWVASRLTGIPFSFMGRAVDIYPPDGALKEKIHDSSFVLTNPKVNVEYLKSMVDKTDSDKIHLIYDPFPLADYKEAPVKMTPPFQILALGRFARFKGFDVLLRATRILLESGLDFHLTLAGAGVKGLQLKLLHKTLRLGDRVSFPGFVTYDGVPDLLCTADVFVMPSVIHSSGERDGIPNVLVEAMLHRLPVVATDVAGLGEVVKDAQTGFLVPQSDPDALARSIIKMTENRSYALSMAERGRRLILSEFSQEKCHGELFELLKKLCMSRG
jgi:glycosyltransferase involved in cell wall biosynthesis